MAKRDPEALPARAVALARAGKRIGLLGGSFNPAHEAHLHVSLIALRRLKLDAVWWLVAPQNPLKAAKDMASLERRLERAREVGAHPDIFVGAPEVELGTQYTVDTIAALQTEFPKARFVWLMGGDNLAEFHRWRRWKEIAKRLPIAVVARPRFTTRALASPAAQHMRAWRIHDANGLPDAAPAWTFIQERLSPISATAIRAGGAWR